VADPVTGEPEESRDAQPGVGAWALLRRADFRRLYFAVVVSELGDSLHYIALMWVALSKGGPLGVVAVRLADSVPAIVFGLHGGVAADRWNRKRMMVGADLVRAAVLVPVAAAGLYDVLPLWGLVVAAFILESATSYFAPAYGAVLPQVVDRDNVQAANGLIRATSNAVSIGGWAIAAGLLAIVPLSVLFALNALSFLVSAALLAGLAVVCEPAQAGADSSGGLREGFAALRPFPLLAAAVVALGLGVTLSSGSWIGGIPVLVKDLRYEAGGFSVVMVGYALGSVVAGLVLARIPIKRKARASLVAWLFELPAYALFATATALPAVIVGAFFAGLAQSAALILIHSAAQADAPEGVLGRVMGLISFVHRGAHATGLLFVSPLFAVLAPRTVFLGVAVATMLLSVGSLAAGSTTGARATS
jgi:MFS family permease